MELRAETVSSLHEQRASVPPSLPPSLSGGKMGFAGMRPTAASLASPSCLVVYEHVTRGRRRRVVDARYTI